MVNTEQEYLSANTRMLIEALHKTLDSWQREQLLKITQAVATEAIGAAQERALNALNFFRGK
jgi:phage gp16-like protein